MKPQFVFLVGRNWMRMVGHTSAHGRMQHSQCLNTKGIDVKKLWITNADSSKSNNAVLKLKPNSSVHDTSKSRQSDSERSWVQNFAIPMPLQLPICKIVLHYAVWVVMWTYASHTMIGKTFSA
jgi:hypothetical protein